MVRFALVFLVSPILCGAFAGLASADSTLIVENGTEGQITSVTIQEAPLVDQSPVAEQLNTAPELPAEIVIENPNEGATAVEAPAIVDPAEAQASSVADDSSCLTTLEIKTADGETIETPTLDLCNVSRIVVGESTAAATPIEISGLPPD